MTSGTAERSRDVGLPRLWWAMALLPLILLGGLILLLIRTGPADALKPAGAPPVERLAVTRLELTPDGIIATVLNDGPDPVTIAQVQVDDAYWQFTAEPNAQLGHLRRATLRIPYPWVEGETHLVKLVTSSGTTFERQIAVAVETPRPGLRYFGIFALIGLYVGVIPVAIGLLWFPMVARLSRSGFDFVLALTVGLLLFLMVDATGEGLEASAAIPAAYQATVLFVFAAAGAYLALAAFGAWLRRRETARRDAAPAGWILALLVAVGIGLHNFGEGLAIGAAFTLGEAALGSLLIVGFALHNTTEGLAIVAPLARRTDGAAPPGSVPVGSLIRLGLIGGVPTIAGAWLGGFIYSPVWALLFLALGVGAIAQVVVQIVGQMSRDERLSSFLTRGPVVAGLFTGVLVMYATGMLIS
jgi:ZIP family zinc transporter